MVCSCIRSRGKYFYTGGRDGKTDIGELNAQVTSKNNYYGLHIIWSNVCLFDKQIIQAECGELYL